MTTNDILGSRVQLNELLDISSSDNENVQLMFDQLTDITNELQALGATEITKHEVVKTLLRSLDSSFDTLALMIQERLDFKTLDPSDILEMLKTHEQTAFAFKARVRP